MFAVVAVGSVRGMDGYAFARSWGREDERLAALERQLDPVSQAAIEHLGLAVGWRCWGAGGAAGQWRHGWSAALGYINAVLGTIREGGFTIAQAHQAIHILGSRALGFTQALFDDSGDGDLDPETAAQLQSQLGATPTSWRWPSRAPIGGALGPCDDAAEFAFALDFILDGLERLQDR